MSKLFKLKHWLTVADAARHLAIVFGEAVTEADVLRLALDGRLRLSVNFVNHTEALPGKIVPIAEATYKEVPSLDGKRTIRLYGGPHLLTDGVVTAVLELDEKIAALAGVYDLPMIGGERLDVENRYQSLTGGPDVTLVGMDGAFVEGRDEQLFQLQTSYDDNEFKEGSMAQLEKLKQSIVTDGIGQEEAATLLEAHRQKRKKFLDERRSQDFSENYFPAGGLPDDSLLVVRTDALADFIQSVTEAQTNAEKPLSTRERDTLLKLVIGMAVDGYGHDPAAARSNVPNEIANILAELGMSVSDDTVRKYLKQAADTVLPAKPHQS